MRCQQEKDHDRVGRLGHRGLLLSGDHSAHHRSGHSDGSHGSGMTAVATATAVVTAAAAFDDSRRRNPHLICRI